MPCTDMTCNNPTCNENGDRSSDDDRRPVTQEQAAAERAEREKKKQELEVRYKNFISAIMVGDANIENVKRLHHHSFVVSMEYSRENPPIYCAASKGYAEIVKYLLDQGHSPVTPNANTQSLEIPLSIAAVKGHLEVVSLLLNKYTDFQKIANISNYNGNTALHFAAYENHFEIVKFLVQNGIPVNKTNEHKESALHIAARKGHGAIVRYLCSQGANINLKNKQGQTPLLVAADNLSGDVKELLRGVDYLSPCNMVSLI